MNKAKDFTEIHYDINQMLLNMSIKELDYIIEMAETLKRHKKYTTSKVLEMKKENAKRQLGII